MDPASWERTRTILDDALNLAPADREPFVRERCSGDRTLCAQILTLLEQHDSETVFAGAPLPHDELDDLPPGTSIGGYVIVDRLGRGGMGQVFLGRDPELRRKVALKCLLPAGSVARKDDRALILHEARAAAAISHPNVATVHHVIEHGDRAFIVMEYVAGESLAARLKRGRLPMEEVVAIARQLAAALSAAHAQGVVHRDLKPANIHITPGGVVKVIDFGVARAVRTMPASGASATAPTTVYTADPVVRLARGGTPPYMSLEQLLGRAVDGRSDIYSFGLVLFEMATGHRPFAVTDPLDLVEAVARGAPRADAADSGVPRALADVIAQALSPDVSSRFQTAAELETALASAQAAIAPVRAPFITWLVRIAVGLVALLVVLGCLGFLSTLVFNKSLGRKGGFQSEPWIDIVIWGQRSLSGPVTLVVLASVFLGGIVTLLQLARTWPPVDWLAERARAWRAVAAVEMLLQNPTRIEQMVAVAGSAAIALLLAGYADVTDAWSRELDTAPRASLEILSSVGPSMFRFRASMVVVAIGFCLISVVRLRRRQPRALPRSSLHVCFAVFAAAVILNTLPHRLIRDNEQERVQFGGNRCYVVGSTPDQFLLFCPDLPPPRNRMVARNDAGLQRPGIRESIFTPAVR